VWPLAAFHAALLCFPAIRMRPFMRVPGLVFVAFDVLFASGNLKLSEAGFYFVLLPTCVIFA